MKGLNRPTFEIEKVYADENTGYIAGVDEAGRGALAGPLSVSIVIFPIEVFYSPSPHLDCINDSKKLTASKRASTSGIIITSAVHSETKFISSEVVDEINVNEATYLAIAELIKSSPVKIGMILVDGNFKFKFDVPSKSVIGGDGLSMSIAAASVLSKHRRDLLMIDAAEKYPQYGFERNKGYGSADHLESIRIHGPSEIHRKSYSPVKEMLITLPE